MQYCVLGGGLDVSLAGSAAAQWLLHCLLACAALMCGLYTRTHTPRSTDIIWAGRGAYFESLTEAHEASLLCLAPVQKRMTDSTILDRHRLMPEQPQAAPALPAQRQARSRQC